MNKISIAAVLLFFFCIGASIGSIFVGKDTWFIKFMIVAILCLMAYISKE